MHLIAVKHQLLILTAPKALAGAQCAEGACRGSAPNEGARRGIAENYSLENASFNDVHEKANIF